MKYLTENKINVLIGAMILFGLFLIGFSFAAVPVTDAHGESMGAPSPDVGLWGEVINTTCAVGTTIQEIGLVDDVTANASFIIDYSNNATLDKGSCSAGKCTYTLLPLLPLNTKVYVVVGNHSNATFAQSQSGAVAYPIAGTNINWVKGIEKLDTTASTGYLRDRVFQIVNITSLCGTVSVTNVTTDLLEPTNNSLENKDYVLFNTSLNPVNGNLTNATINIWNPNGTLFNYSGLTITNTILGNITNTTFWNLTNFDLGSVYTWNTLGCTNSSCAWNSTNFTFTSSAFSETSFVYNKSIFETSAQKFVQNITANPSVSSASAVMWYDGTSYTSLVSNGASGIYSAERNIDIPLQDSVGNKTFFWEWSFTLTGGNAVKQNSTTYSHEVNRTYLVLCNATYPDPFINFTTKEAVNPFPLANSTFKVAWDFWLGGGNVKRNDSYENTSEILSNYSFCGDPVNHTLYVDADIEIDGTGYAKNFHYLSNASITNLTTSIDLYLLNDSSATVTEIQVLDAAQNAKKGVLIQIQLYDVGTDTFYTVAMAKTSDEGKDIVYLNWYATLYKFIFTQNGNVIKTTDPFKISETPQVFTILDTVTFSFDKFRDFVYSLIYNDATQNFVLTFVKPSGLVDQGCLRVVKRNSTADTEICLTCESSSSATLYCNIGGYGNGTFIAAFYATGSWDKITWIYETIGGSFAETIYDLLGNTDATAYAFLFSGIVVSMLFLSPVIAIIGLILGVLGGAALGFTVLNYAEFIGIVIIGGVIIWFVKR